MVLLRDGLARAAGAPLSGLVLAEDPRFYDDRQFAVYDRMRAEAPAYYYAPLDVFLLTRLDDVRYVATHPELFSNASGLTLNQLRMAKDGATARSSGSTTPRANWSSPRTRRGSGRCAR